VISISVDCSAVDVVDAVPLFFRIFIRKNICTNIKIPFRSHIEGAFIKTPYTTKIIHPTMLISRIVRIFLNRNETSTNTDAAMPTISVASIRRLYQKIVQIAIGLCYTL